MLTECTTDSTKDWTQDIPFIWYVAHNAPYKNVELLELWLRTKNYIAFEPILDLAVNQSMPIWAAEQIWRDWWASYVTQLADQQ